MKFNAILIIILAVFLMAFGCEREEQGEYLDPEELIIGDWAWQKSIYLKTSSGDPFILSPDSVSYSITYRFFADGSYSVVKNTELESSGIYWFDRIKFEDGTKSDMRLFTQQGDYLRSIPIMVSKENLVLDNSEVEGVQRIFNRIEK